MQFFAPRQQCPTIYKLWQLNHVIYDYWSSFLLSWKKANNEPGLKIGHQYHCRWEEKREQQQRKERWTEGEWLGSMAETGDHWVVEDREYGSGRSCGMGVDSGRAHRRVQKAGGNGAAGTKFFCVLLWLASCWPLITAIHKSLLVVLPCSGVAPILQGVNSRLCLMDQVKWFYLPDPPLPQAPLCC